MTSDFPERHAGEVSADKITSAARWSVPCRDENGVESLVWVGVTDEYRVFLRTPRGEVLDLKWLDAEGLRALLAAATSAVLRGER